MNRISRIVTALIVCALSTFASQNSSANVIYTYTGNNYTQISDDDPPAGAYTTSMHVSATVELASQLAANFNGLVTPVAFSVNDGRFTLTNSSPLTSQTFNFKTDASAHLVEWQITLQEFPLVGPIFAMLIDNLPTFSSVKDYGDTASDATQAHSDFGIVRDSPGSWSTAAPAATAPEPASLSLIALALAGLGLSRRKRGY